MLNIINDFFSNFAANSFKRNMKRRKVIFEKYQVLLENGLTYNDITNKMLNRIKNKKSVEAQFYQHVADELAAGSNIAEALQDWATPNEITIISAGETAGDAAKGFREAVGLMEKLIEMKRVIVSSSIYPAFLMVALFGIIYGFANFMVPILSDFSPMEQWPASAQDLGVFTMWVSENVIFVILAVAAFMFAVFKSLPNLRGGIRDKILDRIPPYSLYKEIQAGLFLSSLSTLMKSGMTFANSLEFIESESPPYVQDKILEIIDGTNEGKSEGEAMNIEFIGEIGDDIEDFSMGSDIGTAMAKLGDNIVKDKIRKIEASASILKYIAMAIVFVVVIWCYLSFMGITQNIAV
jgi:toxin co-regulated pilus biosynthesis protein E